MLVLGFDFAHTMQHLVDEVTGQKPPLEAYVDYKTRFGVITMDGKTTGRRTQIEMSALRESLENGDLARLGWVPGSTKLAAAFKKAQVGKPFPKTQEMDTNTSNRSPGGVGGIEHKKE